ncbi:MAG: hypothetical protein I4N51_04160 [Acinetobacter sp.]|nr:hypothetical protein [Acinetobacter sp.]
MKNIIIFLILSLFLTPTFAAAPSPSGGGWGPPTVTRVALTDVIEATARQQAMRNGTAVTLEAVVQETINRQSIGKVLLKRLLAGGLLIGATQSLLDGIGWVMEDGVYVKYKDNSYGHEFSRISPVNFTDFDTFSKDSFLTGIDLSPSSIALLNSANFQQQVTLTGTCKVSTMYCQGEKTFAVIIRPAETSKQKIPLTPDLLGDLAVGDYTDPVDESKNKKDKVWTDVENSYKPDVTGNDLNDKINNKLDNAPETNNKPSNKPKPDGDAQKYPAPDQKPGGQGETDNKTDPETGNQTGNFTLPDWCLWAADQCQWHKEEKEVWKEEKEQRDSEKSFWQKVTDWFDWTKEAPEKEEEPDRPEIDDKGIFSRTFDTVFSLSKQCPPDLPYSIDAYYFKGDYTISLNWLCMIFTFLGYPLQLLSHCIGLWIMYEAVIRKEIKW